MVLVLLVVWGGEWGVSDGPKKEHRGKKEEGRESSTDQKFSTDELRLRPSKPGGALGTHCTCIGIGIAAPAAPAAFGSTPTPSPPMPAPVEPERISFSSAMRFSCISRCGCVRDTKPEARPKPGVMLLAQAPGPAPTQPVVKLDDEAGGAKESAHPILVLPLWTLWTLLLSALLVASPEELSALLRVPRGAFFCRSSYAAGNAPLVEGLVLLLLLLVAPLAPSCSCSFSFSMPALNPYLSTLPLPSPSPVTRLFVLPHGLIGFSLERELEFSAVLSPMPSPSCSPKAARKRSSEVTRYMQLEEPLPPIEAAPLVAPAVPSPPPPAAALRCPCEVS